MSTSPASCSVNSSALRSSSTSSLSMPPPSPASSTMTESSSCVMLRSPFTRKSLATSFFQSPKTQLRGISTHMNTRSSGAEKRAKLSGASLATLFGVISPKISTTTVTTTVDTEAPLSESFSSLINVTVPMDDAAMLTMLLPMSRVESSLSKSETSFSTSAERLSPLSASAFRRARLSDENAVSVAEKYAENSTRTAIMTMLVR